MMIHHVCIQTNDYQASLDFYTKALGFTLKKESEGFHDRAYNAWLELNGFFIELQTGKGDRPLDPYEKSREGIVHFCFYVEDLRWTYQQILDAGHRAFKLKDGKAIYRVEDGFLFKIIAPEGTEIEFRDSMIE
jgi:glyoxylase I family protein